MLSGVFFLCCLVGIAGNCGVERLCTEIYGVYSASTDTTTVFINNFNSVLSNSFQRVCILLKSGLYGCENSSRLPVFISLKGNLSGVSEATVIVNEEGEYKSSKRQLYVTQSATDRDENYISVVHPHPGALMKNKLEVLLQVNSSTIHSNISFTALAFFTEEFSSDTIYLSSLITDREIGSWFYDVSTKTVDIRSAQETYGHSTHGYVEFVLSPREIVLGQHFVYPNELSLYQVPSVDSSSDDHFQQRICLFNGPRLDGQKTIWRQQSMHIDHNKFKFIWLLSEPNKKDSAEDDLARSFIADLEHIELGVNPNLIVSISELSDVPDQHGSDGDDLPVAASDLWAGNSTYLFLYAHQQLVRANYQLDDVTPKWCKRFYSSMRQAMLGKKCDVVVYGNTRDFSSDVVVTDTARALGIPLVAELLNLYMHEFVLPDAIVAPSHYAIRHESMHAAVSGESCESTRLLPSERCFKPTSYVIPPSVDTSHFDKRRVSPEDVYFHPACSVSSVARNIELNSRWPCFVVGFVSRLSPEKNPGLFLQAAHNLLKMYPFARFTVVGDGLLRAPLETLAERLGISWAVHFTGWVSAQMLPSVLAGLDVVVSAGLVLETFCIANIEVMAMELPLITFAQGGTGEYIMKPLLQNDWETETSQNAEVVFDGSGKYHRDSDKRSIRKNENDFSVSGNAVVLHRATPNAIAKAVLHLIHNPSLCKKLGQAARETITQRFSVTKQMRQYEYLYRSLMVAKKSTQQQKLGLRL